MNSIERVRIKVGLTKPQMVKLLETNPDNIEIRASQASNLLSWSDEDISLKIEGRIGVSAGTPSSLIARAKEIEEKYDRWVEEVMERLEVIEQASPDGLLRTRDIARVLGISDFHLSQLRIRGVVKAQRESRRRFVYRLKDIQDLVRNNSKTVSSDSRKTRGPLTNAFLSWAAEEDIEDEKELVAASA